jgi:hypothetical protein
MFSRCRFVLILNGKGSFQKTQKSQTKRKRVEQVKQDIIAPPSEIIPENLFSK